jgi:hypothetical protein
MLNFPASKKWVGRPFDCAARTTLPPSSVNMPVKNRSKTGGWAWADCLARRDVFLHRASSDRKETAGAKIEVCPRGAFITLDQCWKLAQAWYAERLNEAWRRMNADEMQVLFAKLGLTGNFWRVT